MPRQPINRERLRGKAPRQRMWEVIRRIRVNVTARAIATGAAVAVKDVHAYMQILDFAGFLEKIDDSVGRRPATWKLVKDTGIHAPRLTRHGQAVTAGSGNQNMWRTMQMQADFSPDELAVYSSTDQHTVSLRTAQAYIKALRRAGYLVKVSDAVSGTGEHRAARYSMPKARFTGMHAPALQRSGAVYDQNLGRVVWQPEKQHDAD